MANIILKQDGTFDATYVPNIFIDHYMTHADGEFVKIYLYLLRCMSHPSPALSVSDIADKFDNTEKDVTRALRYWEKLNLLHLSFQDDELSEIRLTNAAVGNTCVPKAAKQPVVGKASGFEISEDAALRPQQESAGMSAKKDHTSTEKRFFTVIDPLDGAKAENAVSKDQLAQFSKDETVQELLFVAERYLGHTLSYEESRTILYWLDNLGLSQDIIDYLIEYCVAKNHPSIRYMNRIASDWARLGVQTLAEAKQAAFRNSELVYAIMRAFGICDRSLTDIELNSIQEWVNMGFADEIIVAACQKTISSVHKVSFGYTNKILSSWKAQNVRTLQDIQLSDAQFQEAQAKKYTAAKAKTARTLKGTPSANAFNNFSQRTYDYEKLERELLSR